jgi:hypothetical protein
MQTLRERQAGSSGLRVVAKREEAESGPWSVSFTRVLADSSCAKCRGTGQLRLFEPGTPCHCVTRSIFRKCLGTYHSIVPHMAMTKLGSSRRGRPQSWSNPQAEFRADFELAAKRTLTEQEYKLFHAHFLLDLDWRVCARWVGLDRGNFYHAVYRVMQTVGKALREREMFPVADYMALVRVPVVQTMAAGVTSPLGCSHFRKSLSRPHN